MDESERVSFHINIDGKQETYQLPLKRQKEALFVANPHAGIPRQPALVQLDPARLLELPGAQGAFHYKGVLLEIQTQQEA